MGKVKWRNAVFSGRLPVPFLAEETKREELLNKKEKFSEHRWKRDSSLADLWYTDDRLRKVIKNKRQDKEAEI